MRWSSIACGQIQLSSCSFVGFGCAIFILVSSGLFGLDQVDDYHASSKLQVLSCET